MKKNIDVARAWRDEDYFLSLTDEQRASLDAHPAGTVADPALRSITGGCGDDMTHLPTCVFSTVETGGCTYCPPLDCM